MSVTKIICPGNCGYFTSHCKCGPQERTEGGYLVPDIISEPRPGLLGWVARRFNRTYGWVDFRLAEEIERAAGVRP